MVAERRQRARPRPLNRAVELQAEAWVQFRPTMEAEPAPHAVGPLRSRTAPSVWRACADPRAPARRDAPTVGRGVTALAAGRLSDGPASSLPRHGHGRPASWRHALPSRLRAAGADRRRARRCARAAPAAAPHPAPTPWGSGSRPAPAPTSPTSATTRTRSSTRPSSAAERVDTPETRYAGDPVHAPSRARAGSAGPPYQIQNELSLGDKVQRDAFSMSWHDDPPRDGDGRDPTLEWRHDRTFDRDQQEWRGSMRGRMRRSFADDATVAEFGAGGDFVRTSGEGSEFLLDRNAGRRIDRARPSGAARGRAGDSGTGWLPVCSPTRACVTTRQYGLGGPLARTRSPRGTPSALEANGLRRPDHPDRHDSPRQLLVGSSPSTATWRARRSMVGATRLEGEALQYDLEDSTVFFDYQIARAAVGDRIESEGRWSHRAGPRPRGLRAVDPGEGYREIGGAIELRGLGWRALWSVAPAAGWRAYDQDPAARGLGRFHSSYAFYELDRLRWIRRSVDRVRLRTSDPAALRAPTTHRRTPAASTCRCSCAGRPR